MGQRKMLQKPLRHWWWHGCVTLAFYLHGSAKECRHEGLHFMTARKA